MSSSSYVDVLLRKGKRIAISYIISDCLQNENPENAKLLHQVADSLLNPRDAIEKPEIIEWIRWLLAAGKNPDEFAKEVKRFDTATTCGLVWIANFVAYRCRTCAISPCMSLCAECFQKGEHEGHDFNMFRSQAGGACDCGDESVMKKSGFCVRHTQKKKKSRNKTALKSDQCSHDHSGLSCAILEDGSDEEQEGKDECTELLLVAQALMPKIINRLLVELRRNEVNALKDIDVYITNLLNPLTSMGAAMRTVLSEVLLDPRLYEKYARRCECNELDSKSFLEERYRNYVRTRCDLPNFDLHSYYNGCASCPAEECPQKQVNPDFIHHTFIQELVFWMVVYKFPQKLVCFLLNMLPDSDYKEAFAQSFVQHYSRISMMLANFRNYEESSATSGKPSAHDLLSNCVVHVSVQLLSNENLAVKLCERQHLLFIIIASLRATIEGGQGQESNLIPSTLQNEKQNCHRVVRCDHYVMKKHSYWPLVSDLNNILTHQQVAIMFIRSRELFELWLNFIINFQAMNINPREFHKHVEFENDSYYASFSSELEICATPMWTIISHIRSPATAQLTKQVIQITLRALSRWFELIKFKQDDTPNPYQATFHLPLHRYFSVFVRHAVEHQGLNLAELLPDNEEQIKLLLAHPLQIQVNFYEILCNLWVRNGLQIKGQAMTYIQCHFCNSMIDPDLFLIQQLSAKLDPDWFMKIVFERFHVWDWLSFVYNSKQPFFASGVNTAFNLTGEQRSKNQRPNKFVESEQLMPMLEGALTFLCSLFVVQTNLGLSDEQITRQEIVTLLCMSDRTHSQMQDLIPEKCGTTSTRGFEQTLNEIADFRSPALESGGNLSQGMFYPKSSIWLDEYDPIHVLLRAVHRRDYQASIDRFTQFVKSYSSTNVEKKGVFQNSQNSYQPWPPFRLPLPISDRYLDPKRLLYSKVLHGVLFTILHRAVHGNEVSDQVLALTVFLLQLSLTNTRPQRNSPAQRLVSLEYASNEVSDMAYEQWYNSSWILENMNLVIQNVLVPPEPTETTDRSQHDQTPLDGMEVDLHSSDGDEEEEEEDVYQRDEYMHDIDVSQGQIEPPPTMPQLPTTHVPLALTDSPRLPVEEDDPQPSGSGANQSLTQSAGSSKYSSAISVTSQVSPGQIFAYNASSPASNASISVNSPTSSPSSCSSSSSANSSPTSPRPTATSHPLAIASVTTPAVISQDEPSPPVSFSPTPSSLMPILSPINLPTMAIGGSNISNGPSHPSDRPPILRTGPNALSFPGPSTSPGYSGVVFHTPQGSTGMQLSPSTVYPFLNPLTLQMTLQSRPFSPATGGTSLPFLRRSHAQRRRMVNRRRGFSEYYRSGSSKSSTVEMGQMGIGELMRALPASSSSSRHSMPENSSTTSPRSVLVNESFVSLLLKLHSKLTGRSDSYQPNPKIDLNNLNRIGDGAHFVSQCLDTFCALNSNSGVQAIREWKAKLWPHLYKKADPEDHRNKEANRDTDGTFVSEVESPGGSTGSIDKEERRRKVKERQQKLMAEFANKQKAFMKQMNEEMKNNAATPDAEPVNGPDLTINVCDQLHYECVICGQTTPSTCDRLVGMVVLLQSSSILAHCSPKYPLATLKKSRSLIDTAKKHEDRIRLTDENAIQLHEKETLGNYMAHLIDVLRSFDESSWLNAINIGWEGGVHIQSCGHYLHLDCHQSYMQSLKNGNRHRNRPQPEGNDFFCPLCRQSANSVLPINPSINRKPDLKTYLQTQRFNTSSENLCLVEPLIGVLYKCDPKQFLLARPMALITHEATISPDSQHPHLKDSFNFSNDASDSSLLLAASFKNDANIDQVLMQNCAQLIELYNRCPPPDRPFIQSLNHFSGDLTTATTCQYRSVLHEPTPHSLYLYICSILRTNLECELLVRVSSSIPTGSKKSCVLPLFHALAVNAHVLIPHHYTPLWSGISGLEVPERMRSMLFQPQNAVPFLLMDASALLIQLVFALPLNVDSTIFDAIVQILYNLVATQAVAQLCFTFNDFERSKLRNKLHTLPKDTELHTLRGLLGQVMDTLESANGNLFTCLQDEDENAPRSPWPDSELSGVAKQMCLPFLRLAALLRSHLYAQEYPSHSIVKSSEYEILSGMLNLRDPGRLASQDFGFRLPYFVCQTPKLLLSTWLNQYLHFVDKSLIDANRLLHCRPVHFTSPRLLSLPSTYDQLFLHYYQKPCIKCNTCPKEPCICLLCATLVCMKQDCCKRTEGLVFEAVHHASTCGAGTALYLAVHSSNVIVIRGKRACVWGSVYLDMHGEEDRDLKRGRPLYLSELRFAVLEQQWLTHSFDHTNKRWVWHKDVL